MKCKLYVAILVSSFAFSGCQQEQANQGHSHSHSGGQTAQPAQSHELPDGIDASAYTLAAEPDGAQGVIAARESAKNDDEVVILGRIGGGENPWVDGRAAFTIVDPSLEACSDIPGDNCPMPWDYCCETDKLPTASALIQVVDKTDKVIKADARALLKVKELSTVVVQGKARVDDAGNLVVLASGVFVRQ